MAQEESNRESIRIKALDRWENEGGRVFSRADAGQADVIEEKGENSETSVPEETIRIAQLGKVDI